MTAQPAPSAPAHLAPGARIGKCQILEPIGRGGMGAVYRARHVTLDIDVALKVITFTAVTEEERAESIGRFFREARSAAKVGHENIVTVYDVDEEAGRHYMVMELVDGSSARKLVEAGPVPIADAARIARDAARALAAAHRLGIVHRDVKPENLLLTRDGRVKVSDFGIAHTHADPDAKLTRTGHIVGTPLYMAPEQIEGAPPLDGRADVYALGATLYHLVTGAVPYEGTSTFAVCMKHVTAPVPLVRAANPLVPPALEAIIGRMMAKRPADRFPDGDAVAAALEPLAGPRRPLEEMRAGKVPGPAPEAMAAPPPAPEAQVTPPAAPPPPAPAPTAPARAAPGSSRLIAAAGATAIALATIAALFFALRHRPDERKSAAPEAGPPVERAMVHFLDAPVRSEHMVLRDVNGDGRPDIVLAGSPGVVLLSQRENYVARTPAANAAVLGAAAIEPGEASCVIIRAADDSIWRWRFPKGGDEYKAIYNADKKSERWKHPPDLAASGAFDGGGVPALVLANRRDGEVRVRLGIVGPPPATAPTGFGEESQVYQHNPVTALAVARAGAEKRDRMFVETSDVEVSSAMVVSVYPWDDPTSACPLRVAAGAPCAAAGGAAAAIAAAATRTIGSDGQRGSIGGLLCAGGAFHLRRGDGTALGRRHQRGPPPPLTAPSS